MVKFAANLSMLFNEVDFLDRFDAAAEAGFKGVEYLFPYDFPAEAIRERLDRLGLTQVLFDLPCGDWAGVDRGIACQPDRVGEFQDGVGLAVEYARALGCERITCLAGIPPEGLSDDVARATLVGNLQFAAPKLAEVGAKLLLEAINTRDIPGFFVTGTKQALSILDDAGSDNLWLQYDIYHMQVMEGDLAMTITRNADRIAHYQVADNPGRNEPGTGEINYPFLFSFLDEMAYDGWIGCEYRPRADTAGGLAWVKPYLG